MSLLLFKFFFSAFKLSSRIVSRPWSLWYTDGIITSIKNVMVSPYFLRNKSEMYKIIREKQQLLLLSRFCSSKIFLVVNFSCSWRPATCGEAEILFYSLFCIKLDKSAPFHTFLWHIPGGTFTYDELVNAEFLNLSIHWDHYSAPPYSRDHFSVLCRLSPPKSFSNSCEILTNLEMFLSELSRGGNSLF